MSLSLELFVEEWMSGQASKTTGIWRHLLADLNSLTFLTGTARRWAGFESKNKSKKTGRLEQEKQTRRTTSPAFTPSASATDSLAQPNDQETRNPFKKERGQNQRPTKESIYPTSPLKPASLSSERLHRGGR